MWPFSEMSLATATLVGTLANWGLVVSLVAGVISTVVIVQTADVKEEHWADDRKESSERIAKLNNDAARLQADNLALQTVMVPRHIALHDGKADALFAPMAEFTTVSFALQTVNDPEAQNLAGEIGLALAFVGIRATHDEALTAKNPNTSSEGVMVSFPKGDALLEKAGNALADVLTRAGLGVGTMPVFRYGITPQDPKDIASGLVNPIHLGIVIKVGQRPVSQMVEWLKRGRPASFAEPPAEKNEKK